MNTRTPQPDPARPAEFGQERAQRFALALVSRSTEPVFALDPDREFRVIFVNDAACRHFGYSREHLLRMSPADWDQEFTLAHGRRLWAGRTGEPITFESTHRTADGRLVPVEVCASFVQVDGEDFPVGFVRDLSARREAEEALRLKAAALDATANAVVITDRAGTIEWVNPAWTALTGFSAEEAIGQNPRLLKSGVHDRAFYRTLWDTILAGRVWQAELVNRRRDGSLYTEEETITPLLDATGRITHFIGVKQDISARRRAEEERQKLQAQLLQAQKMESVGRLAGGVAHDFNNMLSVILGYTDVALGRLSPPDPLYDDLQEVQRAACRSAELTRQLLAFSRQQTVAPQVLDLNDAIEAMLRMLRRLIGEDIELAWLPGAGTWPVRIDSVQLHQVLTNLCVNARDAIAGAGRITIETHNVSLDAAYCGTRAGCSPGAYALVVVSDNGCGIAADELDHVFEPFYTTKEAGAGTGLGLATIYGIVTQNAGFIDVHSEPGLGTTFKIYLPRSEDVVGPESKDVECAPSGRGETLLLVEDEPAILQLVGGMLEGFGYRVLAASTPDDALRLAAGHPGPIDLLVTDVVMPGMNGPELAARLQALRPGLTCVFMSGYAAHAITSGGVLREGAPFIQKPFTRSLLAGAVKKALSH